MTEKETTTTAREATTPARRRRTALLLAGITLLVLFGASFAANIDINSTEPVEFGQGIEEILACDSTEAGSTSPGVTVTLTSTDPSTTGPSGSLQFSVDGLIVSDIDELCLGKILTVGLYESDGTLLDDVVFELESSGLTAAPYRAGALAGDTSGASGCDPGSPPPFPDGSTFATTSDCYPISGSGLDPFISAQDVAYVALETSDPA